MKYLAGIAGLGLIAACTVDAMPEPYEGQALFEDNCAICHGTSGRGDGAVSGVTGTAPKDLTQIALRNGGVFPRAEVLSMIDGYHRQALPGPNMPEFGALLRGGQVPVDTGDGVMTPTPRPLAALMIYLESIQEG